MAVAAPSSNPSGGLAFGYTFTLTDNFTEAARNIALSFDALSKQTQYAAEKVSKNLSEIKGSKVGLSEVTTQVNRLASAFERLARAKKQAVGVVPSQIALQKLNTRQQNADTGAAIATGRATRAQLSGEIALQNLKNKATDNDIKAKALQFKEGQNLLAQQNSSAVALTRQQAERVRADNYLKNSFKAIGKSSEQQAEVVDNSLGRVMRGLGTMYLGASLFKPLLYSIKVNDEFERAEVRLKGLLGSSGMAKSVLSNVKMDAKNDFLLNSKDLLNANTNLISEGATTERARKMANDVSTLVQVSGGTVLGFTNSMKGIARIMGSNKITGVQANRLQTANIPMNHYFEEFTGKSMYKNGRINTTADEFFKVIGMAAEKYKSVADEMKHTVTGLESMVSEGTTYIMAEFGKINSVVYKKLLEWLDAFTTKLMIFTQTPIGNIVVKMLSAGLVFAATATTLLGLTMAAKAVFAAILPMATIFARTALTGMLVYSMIQSNSDVFIELGVVLSTFMGRFGLMFAAVNIAWRAWQTFNDVTEESYGKMSSLNQMFARAGGYMEAFGEILSTINGDTYELSESLVMKLKSIGAFEGVLKMGNTLLTVYNALKKVYEVGSWVVSLFDGNLGKAVVYGVLAMRAIQFASETKIAFLSLRASFLETSAIVRAFVSQWALIANLQMATGSIIAKLGLVTIAILAAYAAWKLTMYLFDNWGSLSFIQKLSGVLGVLGLVTIAIYAIGTAFGIAAITEYAFLAPLLAIVAVIAALVLGIAELYDYINNPPPDISKAQKDKNIEEIGQRVPSFDGFIGTSIIPKNFDNDMSTQRELNSQRFSPIYAPINQQNSDMSSSQDINVNVHYDGDLIYRSMMKKGGLEDARIVRG